MNRARSVLWADLGWCIAIGRDATGWDAPNNGWAHGIISANYGVYTPLGSCAGYLSSGSAPLRIAANGYYDFYNDF
jgi:hypothetical protein